MAGFLDATHARMTRCPPPSPTVVLPSYNGARKLPVLTPLLALLLARAAPRAGARHAHRRGPVPASAVLSALGTPSLLAVRPLKPGEVAFAPTGLLLPGLKRLLEVRRVVGLRNPAHSLVKLMNPARARACWSATPTPNMPPPWPPPWP
jgi:anthranilate phosphoribosyltransferase